MGHPIKEAAPHGRHPNAPDPPLVPWLALGLRGIGATASSLKKQITILSKTIIKKDAEFSELKADNDKRLYQLSKAKQLIDSADERVSKAEEKASEQEARANCLAHDLNRAEDELRALKRDSNNFTNRM